MHCIVSHDRPDIVPIFVQAHHVLIVIGRQDEFRRRAIHKHQWDDNVERLSIGVLEVMVDVPFVAAAHTDKGQMVNVQSIQIETLPDSPQTSSNPAPPSASKKPL